MGADNHADVACCGTPELFQVIRVGRTRVDHDVAGVGIADQVAVGAGSGHRTGVGCRQTLHVLQQCHRRLGLPVQRVGDLPVGTYECQFTERQFMLHVAHLATRQHSGTRTTGPQRLLGGGAGLQHGIDRGVVQQALQRADGGEDDEELAGLVACQGVDRTHPDRLELLGFIGVRGLSLGHAGHQKRHIETAREVAVGDPVGQHKDLIGRERQTQGLALGSKRLAALQRGDIAVVGGRAVAPACQQHTEFLEALADGRDRLRQVQVALRGAPARLAMAGGVERVDAATGEDVGAGREAGRHGTTRHEHLDAVGRIAQQQHGGSRSGGRRCARRVQELIGAGHDLILHRIAWPGDQPIIPACESVLQKCRARATTLWCSMRPVACSD